MSFNNGRERRKFEADWKKKRAYYAAEGMGEAAIEAMYQFDLEVFNSDRRYAEHTQGMPSQQFDDDGDNAGDDNSALLVKFFASFAVMPQETSGDDRYGWIDEIDNPELAEALWKLSEQDKELLTLVAFDGYGVTEIARMQDVAQPTVSKKITRIKKYLEKFLKKF